MTNISPFRWTLISLNLLCAVIFPVILFIYSQGAEFDIVMIFFLFAQAVPFIINAFIITFLVKNNTWGAAITTFLLIFGITITYADIFISTSSTAPIGFAIIPFLLLVVIPVGYLIGWLINKIFKRDQKG
jgi:hypothetical protein